MDKRVAGNSRRLLRTPRPFPDESLKGFLIRVAEVNGYENSSALLKLAGVNAGYLNKIGAVMNWQSLSKMLNVDISKLKEISHWHYGSTRQHIKTLNFFGHVLPRYLIRPVKSKICPACLRNSNYIRRVWDLAALTVCPVHKCFLIYVCPACKREISWSRYGVSVCTCNYDWRDIDIEEVEESEIALAYQIFLLCKLDTGADSHAHKLRKDNNPLFSQTLPDFLLTINFMSSLLRGKVDITGKFSITYSESLQFHKDILKILVMFDNWPSHYFDFLEKIKGKLPTCRRSPGIYKDFGKIYLAMYFNGSVTLPIFLKKGFEEYIAKAWEGGRATQCRAISKSVLQKQRKYLSLEETAEYMQVSIKWVEYFLESKMLKAVIRKSGKRRLFLIETEKIKELKAEYDTFMTSEQVMNILNIGSELMTQLIHNKSLLVFRGPSIDRHFKYVFKRESIVNFIERIKERAQKPSDLLTDKQISFYSSIRKLCPLQIKAGSFVKMILDGKFVAYGDIGKSGLSGLKFNNEKIMMFHEKQLRKLRNNTLTIEKARKTLGLSHKTIWFLINKKIIKKGNTTIGKHVAPSITQKEILRFTSMYSLIVSIAKKMGVSSHLLVKILKFHHVYPVASPIFGPYVQYVFRKSDLEKVDLTKLLKKEIKDCKKSTRNKFKARGKKVHVAVNQ